MKQASAHHHPPRDVAVTSDTSIVAASDLFRALGDPSRLRLVDLLSNGEWCVTELALATSANMSTVSQQLRALLQERLVTKRRDGKHIRYRLADLHVLDLVRAAVHHVEEPSVPRKKKKAKTP